MLVFHALSKAMLALSLASMCGFSGVLAKYVSEDNANDTARVAKFGVVTSASGDLFSASYNTVANGDVIQTYSSTSESVSSDGASSMVVAPGTSNGKGMTFSIKGTPEVSTKLTLDAAEGTITGDGGNNDKNFTNTDIYLKGGSYSVMVSVNKSDVALSNDNVADFYKAVGQTFVALTPDDIGDSTVTAIYKCVSLGTTDGKYMPIQWSVDGTPLSAAANNVEGVKSAVETALGGNGNTYTPNEDLSAASTVTWAWDFSDADDDVWTDVSADVVLPNMENTTQNDLNDTALGNMIALALDSSNDDYAMAVDAGGTLTKVNYSQIDAVSGSANKVWVAHTGTTTPSSWDADTNIACLTTDFGLRMAVEQVD